MVNPQWVLDLLKSVDDNDADKFVSFLTDDCEFKFGNADAVVGNANVKAAVEGFFGSIKGLKHTDIETIISGDVVATPGVVTYTRHNGTTLSVNFCNLFRMKGDKIQKYNIYIDISQLYV
ncbi:MAG: nuclear transport factor 2 family protein [Ignavibacteriae bacterium]|nr:nuclear transport factor 2 family protein [Ignavibacteriota bacterium]